VGSERQQTNKETDEASEREQTMALITLLSFGENTDGVVLHDIANHITTGFPATERNRETKQKKRRG
jgi:hypothetical protein